mgnify:FL=1
MQGGRNTKKILKHSLKTKATRIMKFKKQNNITIRMSKTYNLYAARSSQINGNQQDVAGGTAVLKK